MYQRPTTWLCHVILYARCTLLSSASVLTSHGTQHIVKIKTRVWRRNQGVTHSVTYTKVLYKVYGFTLYISWTTYGCNFDSLNLLCYYFSHRSNCVALLMACIYKHVACITGWNIHERLLLYEIYPKGFKQNTFGTLAMVPIKEAYKSCVLE
jgi:hypothetical protein